MGFNGLNIHSKNNEIKLSFTSDMHIMLSSGTRADARESISAGNGIVAEE